MHLHLIKLKDQIWTALENTVVLYMLAKVIWNNKKNSEKKV